MFEKIKFILSATGKKLWPFFVKFMRRESEIIFSVAAASVIKIAKDAAYDKSPWEAKLAGAVNNALQELATQSIKMTVTEMIPYIQSEYEELTK